MALYADRVQETTTTTGTGTITLAGAVTGFRAFSSAFVAPAALYYVIVLGAQWEVGLGTLATGTTITRDTVYASSNANALVSFSAGAKSVWSDLPALAIFDLQSPSLAAALTVTRDAIAVTSTDGVIARNTTPATAGVPVQYSPRLRCSGFAWDTTTTTSKAIEWSIENRPVSGATATINGSGTLSFCASVNGGAFNPQLHISTGGNLTCVGTVTGNVGFNALRSGIAVTSTDAFSATNATAATSGVPVQYSPRVRWQGAAWDTTTVTSKAVEWIAENRPASGATAAVANSLFVIANSIAGAAYTDRLTFIGSAIYAGGFASGSGFFAGQSAQAAAQGIGFYAYNNSAASAGTPVRWSACVKWTGHGWDTTAVATKQVDFTAEVRPVSGAAVTGLFVIASNVAGAGNVDRFSVATDGRVWLSGAVIQDAVISPTALSAGGTTHNYSPTGLSSTRRIRQDLAGAHTLTGLAALTTGFTVGLFNISAFPLTLKHEDANSTATWRFLLPTLGDFVIPAGGSVELWYDGTSGLNRWRVSGPTSIDIPLHELVFSTEADSALTTYARQGARIVDMSRYPASIGALSRKVRFVAIVANAAHSAVYNAQARLFDYTNGVEVTSTPLDNTAAADRSIATQYTSSILTVGASSGNIRSDAPAQYHVHFRAQGTVSPPLDRVFLATAFLKISYE